MDLTIKTALRTLLTSKRNIILVLTALFNLVMAVLAAVGHSVDPEQAKATWDPIILAVATLVTLVATSLISSYGKRDPGQPPAGVVLVLLALGLSGCMTALRKPAQDHSIQTEIVAKRCRGETAHPYPEAPCSERLQEDLDMSARVARCIEDTTRGEVNEKCEAGDE